MSAYLIPGAGVFEVPGTTLGAYLLPGAGLFSADGPAVAIIDRGAGSGGRRYDDLLEQAKREDALILDLIHKFMRRRHAA